MHWFLLNLPCLLCCHMSRHATFTTTAAQTVACRWRESCTTEKTIIGVIFQK